MDFEKRLERAIERGHRAADAKAQTSVEQAVSERELKRLHSKFQVELSEHIENCLRHLPDHFPGFQFISVVDDRGWGATVSRDDLQLGPGGRRNKLFSHLEMLVRPFSDVHILNLVAKATIRNKEIFNRSHYELLADVEVPHSATPSTGGSSNSRNATQDREICRVASSRRPPSSSRVSLPGFTHFVQMRVLVTLEFGQRD